MPKTGNNKDSLSKAAMWVTLAATTLTAIWAANKATEMPKAKQPLEADDMPEAEDMHPVVGPWDAETAPEAEGMPAVVETRAVVKKPKAKKSRRAALAEWATIIGLPVGIIGVIVAILALLFG